MYEGPGGVGGALEDVVGVAGAVAAESGAGERGVAAREVGKAFEGAAERGGREESENG